MIMKFFLKLINQEMYYLDLDIIGLMCILIGDIREALESGDALCRIFMLCMVYGNGHAYKASNVVWRPLCPLNEL